MTQGDANAESVEQPSHRIDYGHLLERALDTLPRSAAAILDLDGRFLRAYGGAFGSGGLAVERMIGRSIGEVFPPRTASQLMGAYNRALKGESSSLELLAANDTTWFELEVKPLVDDGRVVAIFGFATDTTGRKTAELEVEQERQFLVDVLDSIGHLVSVKDDNRKLLLVNESYEKYTGIRRDQIIGKSLDDFFPAEIARRLFEDDSKMLERGEAVRVHRRLPNATGEVGTLLTERAPLRHSDGSIYGIVTVGLDITDQLTTERDLVDAERRFEAAFMNARNGMALVGLDGTFLRVNPAMCELTGYPSDELTDLKVVDITHPDDMAEQVELIQQALAGEFDSYSLEKRFTKKSGETIWLMLGVSLVRDDSGRAGYVIVQTTNILARKQLEDDLRDEAGRDPLTELANRRLVERAIALRIEQAKGLGDTATLLLMDLDDFKTINDKHGHETGDQVLKLFARELVGQIRSGDIAARLGGDEFVVLMADVGPDRAPKIAKELMRHFKTVACIDKGLDLDCMISVGWATIDGETESPAQALGAADRSMYEVKRARKSRR